MLKGGRYAIFTEEGVEILGKEDGKLLATGTQNNGLYILDTTNSSTNSSNKSLLASLIALVTGKLSQELWRQQLMYVNKTKLKMLPSLVDGSNLGSFKRKNCGSLECVNI